MLPWKSLIARIRRRIRSLSPADSIASFARNYRHEAGDRYGSGDFDQASDLDFPNALDVPDNLDLLRWHRTATTGDQPQRQTADDGDDISQFLFLAFPRPIACPGCRWSSCGRGDLSRFGRLRAWVGPPLSRWRCGGRESSGECPEYPTHDGRSYPAQQLSRNTPSPGAPLLTGGCFRRSAPPWAPGAPNGARRAGIAAWGPQAK